jgi:hypothetical protein
VLNDLQAEFGMAPAAEESERQNDAQLLFLSLMFGEVGTVGFSCYNITPLPEKCCSMSLFTAGYKRLAEGE